MSLVLLKRVLGFLHKEQSIRLLGGEPTLHSKFFDVIELTLNEKKPLLVFTNGSIEKPVTDFLSNKKSINYLINLSAMHYGAKLDKIIYFLNKNWERSQFGITYNLRFEEKFLREVILFFKRFNVKKELRLGVAAPDPFFSNEYFEIRRNAKKVNQDFRIIAKSLLENKITLKFDCAAIPLCYIEDSTIALLKRNTNADILTTCNNLPLDILPNGEIIPCFGLSNVRQSFSRFKNPESAREYFSTYKCFLNEFIKKGNCLSCRYSKHLCSSGCLGKKSRLLNELKLKDIGNLPPSILYFKGKGFHAIINRDNLKRQIILRGLSNEIFNELRKGSSKFAIADKLSKSFDISKRRALSEVESFIYRIIKIINQ